MSRATDGRFLPGISGNPGGRPKMAPEVRIMLDELTTDAVCALALALRGDDQRLRFLAAQEVLNRTLGRPHQSTAVEITQHKSMTELHLEALKAHNAQYLNALPIKQANPVS